MLTQIIGAPFADEVSAKAALTACRRKYRVALRGAVVLEDKFDRAFYVYLDLGGTGYSVAEWAGNLRCCNDG